MKWINNLLKKGSPAFFLIMFLPFVVMGQQKNGATSSDEEKVAYVVVEKMPRFKGCEKAKDESEADKCTRIEIGKFLAQNIIYPQRARTAGVEGIVYVSFIVDTKGKTGNVKIKQGLGFGCDEEVLRVVSKFPKFTPGEQRGKQVNVQYNLPVSFKLR